MPSQLTDQSHPIPKSLRDKLVALGVDPKTLEQFSKQVELHHEMLSITSPKINPTINPDTDTEVNL